MKNLKLLSLFGNALIALLSFTNLNQSNPVKDGTYKAFISKKTSIQGLESSVYEENVTIKVENNFIMEISPLSFNRSSDKLLRLPLEIDKKGNAIAETFAFEKNIDNRSDKGDTYNCKLTIKKEELTK